MAVARGQCPNCGAPIEYTIGSSISKVCPYCRHVVLRSDRGLENLGRAADLANTPSTVAVGDRGTLRGVGFEVVGRVQLDYGRGPWDEYYVAFSDGSWGWMADAQGNFYVTKLITEGIPLPPPQSLGPDVPVLLGRYGEYRVAERRSARVVSAEGELPFRPPRERVYADLQGRDGAFGTIDYGDGTRPPELFLGHQIPHAEVQLVPRGGERPGAQKVELEAIRCPNCGAALPAPSDPSIERVACRYCRAVSDLRSMQVIARQAQAFAEPKIPLGSSAVLAGTRYIVIGYVERSATIEGETFHWSEYLLYGEKIGFRWLVEDEGIWLFVRPVSGGEVRVSGNVASWHGRSFYLRNDNRARVDYVLGEFYWKVEVGETVRATDYVSGTDVLSREESDGEVQWSYGQVVAWAKIAQAFNLPSRAKVRERMPYEERESGRGANAFPSVLTWLLIFGVALLVIICSIASSDGGSGGGYYSSGGGYGGFGGFGGK